MSILLGKMEQFSPGKLNYRFNPITVGMEKSIISRGGGGSFGPPPLRSRLLEMLETRNLVGSWTTWGTLFHEILVTLSQYFQGQMTSHIILHANIFS